MLFNRFNTSKCKTQAKLCIGRVRLMRNKREAAMKQMRREVAELLRANKQENARIRVEAVIREQSLLQAYEVLEVFLELLTVRLQLLERSTDIPNDMFECLGSLVYSAIRIQDFPELVSIRGMLAHKFGKEFIETASADGSCRQYLVNENLMRCLAISAPDPEVKLALLSDIAQEHGVEWDSHRAHQEMVTGYTGRGPGGSGSNGFQGSQGPPSTFGGSEGGGGGGGGSGEGVANFRQPPPAIYAPPPEAMSPGPTAPSPQSKFKTMLKKVPTLGRSSPHPQEGPVSPPPASEQEWRDAHHAASAAREFSQRAQSAAEAAQRYASSNASSGDLGDMRPPGVTPATAPPPHASGRPASPPQDYPKIEPGGGGGSFTPMTSNLPPGKAGGPQLPPHSQLPPGNFRQRSDEEIQRAYDAAPGPPTKSLGKPSAPPAPKSRDPSPGPPRSASPGFPPAPRKSAEDEGGTIDADLASRFEALKRG